MSALSLLSLPLLFQAGPKADDGIYIGQTRAEFLRLIHKQHGVTPAPVTKADRKIIAEQSPDSNGILKFHHFEIDSIAGSLLVVISGGVVEYAWWQQSPVRSDEGAVRAAHLLQTYYQVRYGTPFHSDENIRKFWYQGEEVCVGVESTPNGKRAFLVKSGKD